MLKNVKKKQFWLKAVIRLRSVSLGQTLGPARPLVSGPLRGVAPRAARLQPAEPGAAIVGPCQRSGLLHRNPRGRGVPPLHLPGLAGADVGAHLAVHARQAPDLAFV